MINAARDSVELDERQVNAVAARSEIALRLGASFTRFQSLTLQSMDQVFAGKAISYGLSEDQEMHCKADADIGSCQFPTLGFVVDRYFRVRNFVAEKFWSIKIMHTRDEIDVTFLWDRHRLFDRAITTILFERCLQTEKARITKLEKKPTSKWKPLPLTTVELQKLGSMFLRMSSQQVMKVNKSSSRRSLSLILPQIAEDLYTKGWISYPRTETDQFDKAVDLRQLVGKQVQDNRWGQFAQE